MRIDIPVRLHGRSETLTVVYERNDSPRRSGFDALDVPFDRAKCLGYPTVHARFSRMRATGYRRYCGFIQFIETVRQKNGAAQTPELSVDVNERADSIGNPYFSYGYPASLYDAPCMNLGDSDALDFTAFTYLVDPPTRMNGNRLAYLAGFSWGYTEDVNGPCELHDLKLLTEAQFEAHRLAVPKRFLLSASDEAR